MNGRLSGAIRGVVLDIEGTTSAIAFVKSTLFPFAEGELGGFLREHGEETAVAAKSAATQGAFYAALALVLGALAGFLGGRFGAPKPVTLVGAYDSRRV